MAIQNATQFPPLPPPSFPAAIDGGLGYDDLLNPPDRPILVELGPWAGFQSDDVLQLIGPPSRELAAIATPILTESDGIVRIYVSGKTFAALKDGDHQIGLQVLRLSGEVIGPAMMTLHIRLSRPGVGPDGTVTLAPPQVEPLKISATTQSASVTIAPYQNMSAGDTITVIWGVAGNEVSRVVAAGDVGRPIKIDIGRAIINAGGTGTGINVAYKVKDDSGDTTLSPSTDVDVVDPSRLDAPVILESTLLDGGHVLNVDTLAGAAATAMIMPVQAGDTITVHVSGTTSAGLPVEYHGTEVTATQGFHKEPLPNAFLVSLLQGEAALWYVRKRGGTTATSHRFNFSVVGKQLLLMAPEVFEAEGDSLDPEKVLALGKSTLAIPHSPLMQPGTRVRYLMRGTSTDGTTIVSEDDIDITASTAFPLQFDIASNEINALDGSTVTFTYTVLVYSAGVPGNGRPVQSIQAPERTYQVRDPSLPLMPAALVQQADGDSIDPLKVDNNIGVKVTVSYPGMQAGDRITLYWYGSIDKTSYKKTITYTGTPLTFLVKKNPFISNNAGGTVTAIYIVERDAVIFNSIEAEFNVGVRVRDLVPPTVDGSSADKLDLRAMGNYIVVRLPAGLTFLPGDLVSVSVGEYTTAARPAVTGATFDIPVTEFARYAGQRVTVLYTVTRGGLSYASEVTSVEVVRTGRSKIAIDFENEGLAATFLSTGSELTVAGGAARIKVLYAAPGAQTVGIGTMPAPTHPHITGTFLFLWNDTQVQVEIVGEPVTHIRFDAFSNADTGSVVMYDDAGPVASFSQVGAFGISPFDYTSSTPIRRLVFSAGATGVIGHGLDLDNFMLE